MSNKAGSSESQSVVAHFVHLQNLKWEYLQHSYKSTRGMKEGMVHWLFFGDLCAHIDQYKGDCQAYHLCVHALEQYVQTLMRLGLFVAAFGTVIGLMGFWWLQVVKKNLKKKSDLSLNQIFVCGRTLCHICLGKCILKVSMTEKNCQYRGPIWSRCMATLKNRISSFPWYTSIKNLRPWCIICGMMV